MARLLDPQPLHEGWTAAAMTDDLRRTFADPGHDPAASEGSTVEWHPVSVPGHWQRTDAFAHHEGPVLYRHLFDRTALGALADTPGQRQWLTFDGIFYAADVWLDGDLVGDTEGYFVPHTFEVSEQLGARSEHLLAVEVACAPQTDKRHKRNLTGVFQHWDALDDTRNPGGIWRPVRMSTTGPVRILRHRVLCREASAERAVVELNVTLDSLLPRQVVVRTAVAGVDHVFTASLAAGETTHDWSVVVPTPELWWPHALGDPTLHDLTVEVLLTDGDPERPAVDSTAGLSDRVERRLGLRSVDLDDWILSVNGERIFCKGTNQGPLRQFPAEVTEEVVDRFVGQVTGAHLDLVRFHGHLPAPEVLAACDEAGLLVWADLPLQWGYHRSVKEAAIRQAHLAVDIYGHHPGIAVWCAHNEPMTIDVDPGSLADPARRASLAARAFADQQLPTWNRSILDRSITRVLRNDDDTRPVVPHSGVLPHLPLLDGTDTHLYCGWYHGDERDLPAVLRTMPRLARFVTEFGAQAVPHNAEFCEPGRWPELDWDRLGEHHCLQKSQFDRYVPPAEHSTFEEWRDATQDYQAQVIRHHVATLRRLKYRPTGGFAQFMFADAHDAVTWSVVDAHGHPKSGYRALAEACAPVVVVADRLPPGIEAGQWLTIDIHVVSDLRVALLDAVVTATIRWPGRELVRGWSGGAPADSCVRIGRVRVEVPDSARGDLTLEVTLRVGSMGDAGDSRWLDRSPITVDGSPGPAPRDLLALAD